MVHVCVHNSYMENLTPKGMVLGSGAFGGRLGHEGRTLTNRISTVIKEAPEKSLASSPSCKQK